MMKKLIAITLCLALTLLACACAASNVTVSTTESTDNKGGNMPPVSTMEQAGTSAPATQMSSQTVSTDLELEPIQPIIPEERETTLSLIREFDLGSDECPVSLQYDEDPFDATLSFPIGYMMDTDGSLYCYYDRWIKNLETGKALRIIDPSDAQRLISSVYVYQEQVFLAYTDGILGTATMDGDIREFSRLSTSVDFDSPCIYPTDNGVPAIEMNRALYGIDGQKGDAAFSIRDNQDGTCTLTIGDASHTLDDSAYIISHVNGVLTVKTSQLKFYGVDPKERHTVSESVFYQFSDNGALLSQFKTTNIICGKSVPCDISFGDASCKSCNFSTVIIGGTVFKNVLSARYFSASNGTLYAMLTFEDGMKLYRINPGYSEDQLSNLEKMDDPKNTCVTCMEAEDSISSASAPSVAVATDEILHPEFSSSRLRYRVDYMRLLEWELLEGHLRTITNSDGEESEIPYYISQAVVGAELTGIPYCHGGLNGYENISATDFRYQRFEDLIDVEYSTGKWYVAGNINHVGYIRRTIGLDCSGLIGSAYGNPEKLSVYGIKKYGHVVEDFSQLQPMDALVYISESGNSNHCMLFVEFDELTQILTVIDCTGKTLTPEQIAQGQVQPNNKVEIRYLEVDEYSKYTLRKVVFSYSSTATHHSYCCMTCDISYTEAHDWEIDYTTSSHTSTCTECHHAITESHTISYRYNTTRHWTYCTDGCGFESTASRPHTLQYGVCTVCGYIENVLNTRPGVEVILEQ